MMYMINGKEACMYAIGDFASFPEGIDPNQKFSGTHWQRIKGRMIVGVDENQDEFNSVNKIGGSKELQEHSHGTPIPNSGGPYSFKGYSINSNYGGSENTTFKTWWALWMTSVSGKGDSGNLPPYITKFLWERVA
ncbi:hypothetical protein GSF08_09710 [Clostridiaceae bacterium DONG20-135]|uniref:Baseplate structural protein Gp10 C-terminal domain-containing protein n=1 Tax=Copranaerobaculum intestinale TaxID=2692629 RepID=A0A6N8U8K2_9FIRM|nr:hypothetical protein [Copranaerobaculum intestinale]MXQ74211.1 hypothetical protein [Copranaerobaculum intestinale]